MSKDIPGLLSIHCLSHRLNLCVTDLWGLDQKLKEINKLVYNLCGLFSRSSSRIKLLKTHEKNLLNLDLKLIKPLDVRWMSKFSAIQRLLLLYPAILKTLQDLVQKEGDLHYSCFILQLKDFRTLGHFMILADIGFIVNPLHLVLQKKNLEFDQVQATLALLKFNLETLTNQNPQGNVFKLFLNLSKQLVYIGL